MCADTVHKRNKSFQIVIKHLQAFLFQKYLLQSHFTYVNCCISLHFFFIMCLWGLLFITFRPKKICEEWQTCCQCILQTKFTCVRIRNYMIKNDDSEFLYFQFYRTHQHESWTEKFSKRSQKTGVNYEGIPMSGGNPIPRKIPPSIISPPPPIFSKQ